MWEGIIAAWTMKVDGMVVGGFGALMLLAQSDPVEEPWVFGVTGLAFAGSFYLLQKGTNAFKKGKQSENDGLREQLKLKNETLATERESKDYWRKRAQAAEQRQVEWESGLVHEDDNGEVLVEGLVETDAQGELTWVNDEMTRMTGVPLEDALGGAWINVIHPDDRDRVAGEWLGAIESGESLIQEFRIVRTDGALFHVRARTDPVHRPDGSTAGWMGRVRQLEGEHE